jgi:beta-lactamase regulating signal transducer with metallopeptidase domain
MNTLDTLFDWFLTATLRASWLILAVWALQAILRRGLPARWRHALWFPVVLVLAAPGLPQSRWSMENWPKAVIVTPPAAMAETAGAPPAGADSISPALAVSPTPTFPWRRVTALAWLGGVGLLLLLGMASYLRTLRRLRRGEVPLSAGMRGWVAAMAAECGLRQAPRVLVSRTITSPAVTGFFRPLLLLPANLEHDFSEEEVSWILRHEITHLRRHDLAANWLLCLLQALHWCNPLVWLAFARLRADREAACDEQVLAATSGQGRAEYGGVLLKLAAAPGPAGFALGCVGIFGPGTVMRSRILGIARYRRAHAAWSVVGLALMAGLVVAGATRALADANRAQDAAPAAKGGKVPQVLIEARFLSVPARALPIDIMGDQFDTPALGTMWVVQRPESAKQLVTQITAKKGTKTVATPRLITLDGQKAMIQIGEELPAPPGQDPKAQRFVGLVLEVTPRIVGREVNLNVVATRSTALDARTGQPAAQPIQDWEHVIIDKRRVTSTFQVKNGYTLTLVQDGKFKGPEGVEPRTILTISPQILGDVELPAKGGKAEPDER